jgi:glutamyl-tRNA synthetase
MNGVYIRSLSLEDFTQRAIPFLDRDLPAEVKRPLSIDYVRRIMPLIQERARTLADVARGATLAESPELAEFFFVDELSYEPELLIVKKMNQELAIKALKTSIVKLKKLPVFDEESLEAVLRPLAEELGLKTGQLFGTLRVAVTGRTVAPPLFQTMAVLGKERCLERIKGALKKLQKMPEDSGSE